MSSADQQSTKAQRVSLQQGELKAMARSIRADTWKLSERWSDLTSETSSAGLISSDKQLIRFGEIPAFLAALAHHLEQADDTNQSTSTFIDDNLRAAAIEHARARAAAGYDQRELLAEFITLRRVLWEHFANQELPQRPTFAGERVVNLLLDAVIVEAADQFFSELTNELVYKAERDALTELYNRQAFHEKLSRELSRAQRFDRELTVVTIDLDAFKQVNDTLGHLAGDAVLKRLASLLTTHTREQDIVGRLGGDEFAVALVETGLATARDLIRRVRIHLVPARRQFGLPREFGISFGTARFPSDGNTIEKLLFHADSGMYRQKGSGRELSVTDASQALHLNPVRVLVADDDASLRSLCRSALSAEGFEVSEAPHGERTLELARELIPDVLLLDISMPYRNGWEVLKALNEDASTSRIPVVMMTASASQENVERADRAGVIDFLSKPFEPSELVGAIHHVLELTDQSAAASA